MTFGVLPGDGEAVQAGPVRLPFGRHVIARGGRGRPVPVAWATVEPVDQPGRVCQQLPAAHRHAGLVPFVLRGLDPDSTHRPWDTGELGDPQDISGLDGLDPAGMLRPRWDGRQSDPDDGEPYVQHAILARVNGSACRYAAAYAEHQDPPAASHQSPP